MCQGRSQSAHDILRQPYRRWLRRCTRVRRVRRERAVSGGIGPCVARLWCLGRCTSRRGGCAAAVLIFCIRRRQWCGLCLGGCARLLGDCSGGLWGAAVALPCPARRVLSEAGRPAGEVWPGRRSVPARMRGLGAGWGGVGERDRCPSLVVRLGRCGGSAGRRSVRAVECGRPDRLFEEPYARAFVDAARAEGDDMEGRERGRSELGALF